MGRVSSIVLRAAASVAAILVIAGAIAESVALFKLMPPGTFESRILGSKLKRLDHETFLAESRRCAIQMPATGSTVNREMEFEVLATHALDFMDPEGMESILEEALELGINGSEKFGKLRASASNLLAERARKRRFDSHQLMLKIQEIDSRLATNPWNSDLQQQKDILVKTRAILLTEYPRDTQRALVLNSNNARAIYDLCRFMQDKIGSYDRRIVIKNFERVIELRSGSGEKDGDFLNANINLTVLSADIGNDSKARCYSAQTLEKHLARSRADYEYLFGSQPDGRINEPEFREVTNRVNPTWSMEHSDCIKIEP